MSLQHNFINILAAWSCRILLLDIELNHTKINTLGQPQLQNSCRVTYLVKTDKARQT